MSSYTIPGVYREEIYAPESPPLSTGVPAFLGYTPLGASRPAMVTTWPQYMATFGADVDSFMASAVRGFFENGGATCYVVGLSRDGDPSQALGDGLLAMDLVPEADLLCIPDALRDAEVGLSLQQQVVDWCDRNGQCFAILDALPHSSVGDVLAQWRELDGRNAALYHPWLGVTPVQGGDAVMVPPCGHVAGVFARTDREQGFFAAPANRSVAGAVDLQTVLTNEMQQSGDPFGVVNCIRMFPARGLRLWGACTISGQNEWHFVNVCRTQLTLNRWLNTVMPSLVFEPNTPALWARIRRTVTGFLEDLHRRGGLAGATAAESFFVRCDASNTPPALREDGRVVADVGFAPAIPSQFILVRLIFAPGEFLLTSEPDSSGKESQI